MKNRDDFDKEDMLYEINTLRTQGVVAIEKCLPYKHIVRLSNLLLRKLEMTDPEGYGDIHCTFNRADLEVDMSIEVMDSIRLVLSKISPVLKNVVGKNPRLVELGGLISLPGCIKQPIHADSDYSEDPSIAEMITTFVALIDIDRSMGPLEVWPETHLLCPQNDDYFGQLIDRGTTMEVSSGTAVLMNSKTWHRGTDNFSCKVRPVFYFSFLADGTPPTGPTWTLYKELSGKWRLNDFLEKH
ncbi:phytanoyl-CoA dioxygenase family protein [Vibrio cholerae]